MSRPPYWSQSQRVQPHPLSIDQTGLEQQLLFLPRVPMPLPHGVHSAAQFLTSLFSRYGNVVHVLASKERTWGLVRMSTADEANECLLRLANAPIPGGSGAPMDVRRGNASKYVYECELAYGVYRPERERERERGRDWEREWEESRRLRERERERERRCDCERRRSSYDREESSGSHRRTSTSTSGTAVHAEGDALAPPEARLVWITEINPDTQTSDLRSWLRRRVGDVESCQLYSAPDTTSQLWATATFVREADVGVALRLDRAYEFNGRVLRISREHPSQRDLVLSFSDAAAAQAAEPEPMQTSPDHAATQVKQKLPTQQPDTMDPLALLTSLAPSLVPLASASTPAPTTPAAAAAAATAPQTVPELQTANRILEDERNLLALQVKSLTAELVRLKEKHATVTSNGTTATAAEFDKLKAALQEVQAREHERECALEETKRERDHAVGRAEALQSVVAQLGLGGGVGGGHASPPVSLSPGRSAKRQREDDGAGGGSAGADKW